VTGLCHHHEVGSRIRSVGVRVGVLIAATCVVASCSTSSPPPPPPAPAPPSPGAPAAPTLDGWKLTLPTENAKGDAAIVDPAQPSPPYLTMDGAGALVFWAPVNGATTKNSDHARTELDSLTNFTAGSGKHSLTGSAIVNQVPSDAKDVIIAQIHGADDVSSVPFVMLHWNDGELKVVVKTVRKGSASQNYPLTSGIPLGAKFDFGITDNGDGTMTFTANYAGDTPQASGPMPPEFAGATVRFQAGAYQQSISTGTAAPDDGARVTFSALTVS
jgi:Alginate lyase